MKKFNFMEILINLRKNWKFAKKNKKYLYLYLMFYVILCIIGLIVPIISAKQLVSLNNTDLFDLLIISLVIFFIEVLRNFSTFFGNKFVQLFFRETMTNLQLELSKSTISLETKEIDNNPSGIFIDRLTKDTKELANIFDLLVNSITDVIINIGVLIGIFIISKIIFIYFVVVLTILFVLNKMRIREKTKQDKKLREINEKNTSLISEMIKGLRDIKSLASEDNFISIIRTKLYQSNDQRYKMTKVDRNYTLFTGCIKDLFILLFILIGIKLVNNNMLSIENFIILYVYRYRVLNLLNFTTRMIEYLKDFNLSANRIFEVIDGVKFKIEKFGEIDKSDIKGNFEFKNVSFGYKKNKRIINNISFKINSNETVAFVGKSGSGKSTIFSLLAKMYNIDDGNIYIDNININSLNKKSIRDNISIINQNPYIFNFSIRDNLKIVKQDATDDEIIEACKKASLNDFINSLPDKYDTLVGEGGVNLSGGQRQRLAIARAFIKNSKIILFDEATSALDNKTQKDIQDVMVKMKKNHTILIIAHRLSTVKNADRLYLIEDGKIMGEGTHKQLMKGNKKYKLLYEAEVVER